MRPQYGQVRVPGAMREPQLEQYAWPLPAAPPGVAVAPNLPGLKEVSFLPQWGQTAALGDSIKRWQ
jgi:hypothetical protein